MSLSLFVWIQGLIFFFSYEKDLIHIKLASAIPVKRAIYLFIHSFKPSNFSR